MASRNPAEEILIPNPQEFISKLRKLIDNGIENLEIVSDFDFTFTRFKIDETRGPSTYQLLQSSVLSGELAAKVLELYNFYHPIEIDPVMPIEEKQKYMHEWWDSCNVQILETGFNRQDLPRFIQESGLYFRFDLDTLLRFCKEKEVPITVLSGGIGNLISTSLEMLGEDGRAKVVSNFIGFDELGKSNGFLKPDIRADKSKALEGVECRKGGIVIGDLPSVRSLFRM